MRAQLGGKGCFLSSSGQHQRCLAGRSGSVGSAKVDLKPANPGGWLLSPSQIDPSHPPRNLPFTALKLNVRNDHHNDSIVRARDLGSLSKVVEHRTNAVMACPRTHRHLASYTSGTFSAMPRNARKRELYLCTRTAISLVSSPPLTSGIAAGSCSLRKV